MCLGFINRGIVYGGTCTCYTLHPCPYNLRVALVAEIAVGPSSFSTYNRYFIRTQGHRGLCARVAHGTSTFGRVSFGSYLL
jgi:hypothetical protein